MHHMQGDTDALFKLSWMVGDDASAVRAAALDALAVCAPTSVQGATVSWCVMWGAAGVFVCFEGGCSLLSLEVCVPSLQQLPNDEKARIADAKLSWRRWWGTTPPMP